MEILIAIILAGSVMAVAHAYMGETLPIDAKFYPKRGRDQLAFLAMTVPFVHLFDDMWFVLALFLAFWGMFANSPARILPWKDNHHWLPNGLKEPALKTALTVTGRYTWGSIGVAGVLGVAAHLGGAGLLQLVTIGLLPPLVGLAMGVSHYVSAQYIDPHGDMQAKLLSGGVTGFVIMGLSKIVL